jgi:hypothetical protein
MRTAHLLRGMALLTIAACGPTNFPDAGAVTAAQAKWCESLAKVNGADAKWEHMSACKGASPTGSAAYIRGMAKCFPEHKAAQGDKAADAGLLVAECRDEVLLKMAIDDAVAREGIDARCDRAARCEKANVSECVTAAKQLEGVQRATLYGIYNGAAFHQIADCLRSSSCGADENVAQNSCYKQGEEKLLWFP